MSCSSSLNAFWLQGTEVTAGVLRRILWPLPMSALVFLERTKGSGEWKKKKEKNCCFCLCKSALGVMQDDKAKEELI